MKNTPWGIAESDDELAEGIILYSTDVHGGIWLSPERQEELGYSKNWLNTAEWWEEDHDWAVPYAFFCEAIWKHCKPRNFKKAMKMALWLVKTYHPDMLTIIKKRHRAFSEREKQCDSQRKFFSPGIAEDFIGLQGPKPMQSEKEVQNAWSKKIYH
jgi:hypothetical protein